MFNLLKSDLYRLVHGKMLWVTLTVLLAIVAAGTGLIAFAASPEFAQMVNAAAEMNAAQNVDVSIGGSDGINVHTDEDGNADVNLGGSEGVDIHADASGDVGIRASETSILAANSGGKAADARSEDVSGSLSADVTTDFTEEELQTLNDKTFDSLSYCTAQMSLTGGLLGILSGLVVGLFLMSDFASGFAKVVLSSRRSRSMYYAEKLVLVALISGVFTVAAVAFSAILNAITGFTYNPGESAGELALWCVMTWLVLTAYNCIVAVVAWASRSKVATVLAVTLISTTLAEQVVLSVIAFASALFPALAKTGLLLPSSCIDLLGEGGASLLAPQASLLFPPLTPTGHITLVCVVYIVVFAVIALSACKRKDAC